MPRVAMDSKSTSNRAIRKPAVPVRNKRANQSELEETRANQRDSEETKAKQGEQNWTEGSKTNIGSANKSETAATIAHTLSR